MKHKNGRPVSLNKQIDRVRHFLLAVPANEDAAKRPVIPKPRFRFPFSPLKFICLPFIMLSHPVCLSKHFPIRLISFLLIAGSQFIESIHRQPRFLWDNSVFILILLNPSMICRSLTRLSVLIKQRPGILIFCQRVHSSPHGFRSARS